MILIAFLILETAFGPSQEMQDLDSELIPRGIEHSQKVKAIPLGINSESKNCVSRPAPIAISRLMGLYQLQAEKAKYNGHDLILSDAIEITHPIGHLSARRAILHNFKMDRKIPFQTISLDGQVCVHAVTKDRDLFLYADHAEGKIDASVLYGFQDLRCLGSVEITTSDAFTAKGGEAQYHALANRGRVIELMPTPLNHDCVLIHERDQLKASKVRFEMDTRKIICDQPRGEIVASWKKNNSITFVADRLVWQENLILEGNVSLSNVEGSLSLHSNQIILSFATDQKDLTQVVADGPTQLTFPNKEALLICEGKLTLDPAVRILKTDQPLSFFDKRVNLEAGCGWLTYQETNQSMHPEAIYCDHSVRLISSIIQNQESFALADQLVYFPESRTIILSSRPPNRVLFWQTSGDMTLSAPEVHVRFDPKTKQETVQGIGDVHFRFTLQEENMLETIFSKYL